MMNFNFYHTENGMSATMSDRAHTCGNGYYESKPSKTEIVTLYSVNDVEMKQVTDGKVTYQIYMEGDYINTYTDRKTAEMFFIDFAGITKAKLKKLA